MKALFVTDFHGHPDAIDHLREFVDPSYDVAILGGDLTQKPPEQLNLDALDAEVRTAVRERVIDTPLDVTTQASEVFDVFCEASLPVFSVPGNADVETVLAASDNGENLHDRRVTFGEYEFVGFGGTPEIPLPLDFSFQYTEDEIERRLLPLARAANDPWILVTHTPPYDTDLDVTTDGEHIGSRSIRRIVEAERPLVHLCGHVHEAGGVGQVGETTVVNPGPIKDGYAAEIVIDAASPSVTLLER